MLSHVNYNSALVAKKSFIAQYNVQYQISRFVDIYPLTVSGLVDRQ